MWLWSGGGLSTDGAILQLLPKTLLTKAFAALLGAVQLWGVLVGIELIGEGTAIAFLAWDRKQTGPASA